MSKQKYGYYGEIFGWGEPVHKTSTADLGGIKADIKGCDVAAEIKIQSTSIQGAFTGDAFQQIITDRVIISGHDGSGHHGAVAIADYTAEDLDKVIRGEWEVIPAKFQPTIDRIIYSVTGFDLALIAADKEEDEPETYKGKITPAVIAEVERRFNKRSFEDISQELDQLIDDVLADNEKDGAE
ncbi:MAG: hypothetical protein WC455_16190 [Dehalococcoidia bacterium]